MALFQEGFANPAKSFVHGRVFGAGAKPRPRIYRLVPDRQPASSLRSLGHLEEALSALIRSIRSRTAASFFERRLRVRTIVVVGNTRQGSGPGAEQLLLDRFNWN